MELYIVPSVVKISQMVSELLSGHDFHYKIFKGTYFRKNVGGVMVLVLCKLSYHVLYLYKVS